MINGLTRPHRLWQEFLNLYIHFWIVVKLGIQPLENKMPKSSLKQPGLFLKKLRRYHIAPSFLNTDGSNCTSLGRYRIGALYTGRFGRAYKLYGLDSTNSQAFRRNIVLHSFSYVPDAETDPYAICNSLGCPMVSPGFLQQLEPLINHSSRPILLWGKEMPSAEHTRAFDVQRSFN
jgi:hypothetical protein